MNSLNALNEVMVVAADDSYDWTVFHEPGVAEPLARWHYEVTRAGPDCRLVVFSDTVARRVNIDPQQRPDDVQVDGHAVAICTGDPRLRHLRPEADLDPDIALRILTCKALLAPVGAVGMHPGLVTRTPVIDWHRPSRYTLALAHWQEMLQGLPDAEDQTPQWLQHQIARELARYLRADADISPGAASLDDAELEAFHLAFRGLLERVSDERILRSHLRGLRPEHQAAALLSLRGRTGYTSPSSHRDPGRGLTRHSYFSCGPGPAEDLDNPDAGHHKNRRVTVLGRDVLVERIRWLPSGDTLTVSGPGRTTLPGRKRRRHPDLRAAYLRRNRLRRVLSDLYLRIRAASPAARRRFAGAWLLMDRDTMARDNAEHLYRHLARTAPEINAWFVLRRSCPDWDRLRAEGFRLIDFESADRLIALKHCAHLVSSQADDYVVRPFRGHVLGRPEWRYTFLQHGVLRHDLSRWLNPKPIDMFVTSTPDELEAVAGESSRYEVTTLETQMTGLARHDRLDALARTKPRDLLLVLPTWRSELLGNRVEGNRRELLPDFWASPYARSWREFLESDNLHQLCRENGWQPTFVLHPNMEGYVATNPLPEHVGVHAFSQVDIQELLASAAAVVTDYSSLASDAAYLERPVVYFQFDQDEFFAASHFHRPGSWSYTDDGFGPVTRTAESAVDALREIARSGVDDRFTQRMRDGFPLRDGRCCDRTVQAIRGIDRIPS